MTRFITILVVGLAVGCAQPSKKEVQYLPEDGEAPPPPGLSETTVELGEQNEKGEIDLGIDGEYSEVAVDEGSDGEATPAAADKACEVPDDCKGDPNMDAMGTWDCQQNQCIFTPKINLDSFKPK